MEIVGLLLLASFLIINYVNAPKILGLSKDNPKVKTARKLQLAILIYVVARFLIPIFGIDELFSNEINGRLLVIVNAIAIMYFGNLLPKLQIYRKIDAKNTWATGDENVWKRASKIFAYLSFVIGIAMIILSFYFSSTIIMNVCHFIWIGIPLLYLLLHYGTKFKGSSTN